MDAGAGPREKRGPQAISAYLGSSDTFDTAMASFAEEYADQNESDYQRVRRAADEGLIHVEAG